MSGHNINLHSFKSVLVYLNGVSQTSRGSLVVANFILLKTLLCFNLKDLQSNKYNLLMSTFITGKSVGTHIIIFEF